MNSSTGIAVSAPVSTSMMWFMPTLKRLFCDPFEDLFEALGKADPVPLSVIERSLMNSLWPLVEAQVGKERMRAFRPALQNGPERKALTEAFWGECAAAVSTF